MTTPGGFVNRLQSAPATDVVHTDDAVLIARAKGGDGDAFNLLVDRYSCQVYNFAYRMTNNREDAEDVYQDAFIHAFKGIRTFRADSAFSTWIYRIVRNVYLDEQKRRRSRPYVSLDENIETQDGSISRDVEDSAPRPDEIVQTNERRRVVRAAIANLPERQREILVLYDIQGCKYEEIAFILGINVGTVKSRLNRARKSLRDRLLPCRELFDL